MTSCGTTGLAQAAAEAVREASREPRLATCGDVLAMLLERGLGDVLATPASGRDDEEADPRGVPDGAQPAAAADAAARLAALLACQPGIAAFVSLSGQTVYHAPELLSRTYALILDRKDSPIALVAEEIRTNSRDYPRPVPVKLFEAPPFDLSPEEIEAVLRAMAAGAAYQDITFAATTNGAVYLFSSLHLKREYAAFLAERAETLVLNP